MDKDADKMNPSLTRSTIRQEIQDLRDACNTLVRFTQDHTSLADKERNLIVMVVRSLEQNLASSSSPHFRDRRALGRRLINPIIPD